MLRDTAKETGGGGEVFAAAPTQDVRRAVSWFADRVKRGRKEKFSEIVKITPAIAEVILRDNTSNRPLTDSKAQNYARLMKEGRWALTGETIIVNRDGALANGQHRLRGCVLAGVSFETNIMFGVEADAFSWMDRGRVRSGSDVFSIYGVPNSAMMAAAVRVLVHLDAGTRTFHSAAGESKEPQELYEIYLKHKRLQDSAVYGRMFSNGVLPTGLAAALHYVCARKDRELANEFFEKLGTAAGMGKTEPVYFLWRRLTADREGVSRLPMNVKAAFTIIAFNKTRINEPLRILRWTAAESFPKVV